MIHRTLWGLVTLATLGVAAQEPLQAQNHAASSSSAEIRLEVASGTTATYRVREQLARLNFPNDAVGTTKAVTGSLVVAPDGTIRGDQSKLSVDLRTLKSDAEKRDEYLRERTLQTDRFPLAEFTPRRAQGLSFPFPTSGTATIQLIGDMVIHGVKSEITWNIAGTFGADQVTGRATTRFPFSKFRLTIPRVFGLISVKDDIQLEVDLKLRRTAVQ